MKTKTKKWKFGSTFIVFDKPPKELIPTKENIGQYLEGAGYSEKDYFKLLELNKDNVLTINSIGSFQSLHRESVILHRNDEIRHQTITLKDILLKARTRRKKRRK